MNPFANTANTSGDKIEQDSDRLGGGFVWESGAYEVTIKQAYAGVSKGGANSLNFEVEAADGRKFKWTEWVTSGTAKGCLPYYEKDGKKSYLPGFNNANAIAMFATKKELHALTFEEKLVKLRNPETKTEVPTPAKVATELLGKKIILGIAKVETNKQVKVQENGKDVYKPTAETRFENEVQKIFFADNKCTIAELREAKTAGASPTAKFYEDWVKERAGKVIDKVKKDGLVAAPTAGGAAAPTDASGAEVDSLFD